MVHKQIVQLFKFLPPFTTSTAWSMLQFGFVLLTCTECGTCISNTTMYSYYHVTQGGIVVPGEDLVFICRVLARMHIQL